MCGRVRQLIGSLDQGPDHHQLQAPSSTPHPHPHSCYNIQVRYSTTTMSPTVSIGSSAQFSKLLGTSSIVITDCKSIHSIDHPRPGVLLTSFHQVYADWCGPCKTISPTFESLSTKYSKPNRITFTKVNVDNQQEIAQQYGVSAYVYPLSSSRAPTNTTNPACQPSSSSAMAA